MGAAAAGAAGAATGSAGVFQPVVLLMIGLNFDPKCVIVQAFLACHVAMIPARGPQTVFGISMEWGYLGLGT